LTNAGRSQVNTVARFVAKSLVGMAGAKLGYESASWVGGSVGAKIGWEAPQFAATATSKVFKAMMNDPKIAHNLLFAAESGARPEFYGPMIASMIVKNQTEAADQERAEQIQKDWSSPAQ